MAIEVESIVVTCPRCGEDYVTWRGVGIERPDPEPCPSCGFTLSEDPRLHRDGPVQDFTDEDRRAG